MKLSEEARRQKTHSRLRGGFLLLKLQLSCGKIKGCYMLFGASCRDVHRSSLTDRMGVGCGEIIGVFEVCKVVDFRLTVCIDLTGKRWESPFGAQVSYFQLTASNVSNMREGLCLIACVRLDISVSISVSLPLPVRPWLRVFMFVYMQVSERLSEILILYSVLWQTQEHTRTSLPQINTLHTGKLVRIYIRVKHTQRL